MNGRLFTSTIATLALLFLARSASAATCKLGDHEGIDEVEAKTAASVVCHEVGTRGGADASYEVELGRLSGRTLVTVIDRRNDHRVRTFVSGLDEIDVAAPRLAESLVESKPLVETRNVDNVLAEEGRPAKKVASEAGATMGTFVMSSLGTGSAPAAGIDVGLAFRTGHFGISGSGRLGGVGSGDTKIGTASVDVGGRLYLTSGDHAPFVGAGVAMSYFNRNGVNDDDRSGSGASGFATIGIEALRSSHVGVLVAARVDLPFYELEGEGKRLVTLGPSLSPSMTTLPPGSPIYVVPVSLNLALAFH